MIHDESTPRQWRHVDTCANPANIASRGAKGSELHTLELWLHGPKFCGRTRNIRELRYGDYGLRTTAGRALSFVCSTGLSRANIER